MPEHSGPSDHFGFSWFASKRYLHTFMKLWVPHQMVIRTLDRDGSFLSYLTGL